MTDVVKRNWTRKKEACAGWEAGGAGQGGEESEMRDREISMGGSWHDR